jgi:glyoxylase-like metal-dependent hydrolase (beta-lactamase superfamily II)
MSIRAEAIPLEGPLPGGVEGTSVTVEPIEAGRAKFPAAYFERESGPLALPRALGVGSETANVPVPVYLVRHPAAGHILIDTGLHPSIANDPRDNMGRLMSRYFELEQGKDVVSKLRAKGLSPSDIHVVVLTHLHTDHASAISAFGDATFVLSAAEWEVAQKPKTLKGYRAKHYDHAFDYCTVDFDADYIESYGPFGRTFDLFGDGSVRMVYTPGHTAGHCSVILRLPRRDFVVAADVAYTWRQLTGGPEPYMVEDRHNWRRSLKEMQAYRQQYPYAIVVPGHDQAFFDQLEDRYEE